MNNSQIACVRTVPFMGAELVAAQDDNGQIWAGVRWICEGLGLSEGQTKAERLKVQNDRVLSKGVGNFVLPTKGGNQETLCLQLEYVPLWLAKISITPNMRTEMPELAATLEQYQLKAKDALADAFLPRPVDNLPDRTTGALGVGQAVQLAKILASAPVERVAMIVQVLGLSGIDLDGLDEISDAGKPRALIDTTKFLVELTKEYPLTKRGYLIPPEKFNRFCIAKGLQPKMVRRHLYAGGYIESSVESTTQRRVYSSAVYIDGKAQRRVVVKPDAVSKHE